MRQALRDYDSGKIINSDLSYSRARLVPDVPSPAQDYSPPKVKQAEKLQRASSSLISYDEDEEDALSSGSSSEDYSSSSDEAPKRTPVKITPSKSTPVKITPSRVTPSRTTPSRTPPSKTPPSSTPRRTPERKPPSSINSTADQLPSYLKIVLGALVASALLFIFQGMQRKLFLSANSHCRLSRKHTSSSKCSSVTSNWIPTQRITKELGIRTVLYETNYSSMSLVEFLIII